MQVLYPRCCGLDIHKKTVVACVLLTEPDGTTRRFVRTFGTMTGDLLALGDWLSLHEVVHVAMESTGVLWRPVFNVLEFARASRDRFFLCIDSHDRSFNRDVTSQFLESLGARQVADVYK